MCHQQQMNTIPSTMKLLIFGATGTVGQQLVAQALEAGHEVTAFTRNTSSITPKPGLCVAQGDVLNAQQVRKAMGQHDAVMVALGAGRKGGVRAEGTRNIINAMQQAGIQQLICQTTLGCGQSWGNLNFFWKNVMFGWFIRAAFQDHELQEQYVRGSRLQWTIVRPGAFTNGPRTGQYKHGFNTKERSLALKISRADVAHFMLKALGKPAYRHQMIGLSY